MRKPRTVAALIALLLLPLLTSCSDGRPAKAWAASICSALTPWRAEITALTTRAQQQTPQSTTPDQAKENLVRMLEGARDASERARSDVAAAGVPEVDGGRAVADGVIGSLTKVRDAYGKAKDRVQGLSTAEPETFYTDLGKAMDALQTEYKASALDTDNLSSTELQAAFTEVPECR